MGCFWSPDALFGCLEGVVRTRVGYSGGSTTNPTYRTMADHIETVQLDFKPAKIGYQNLLDFFFSKHNPTREPWKRQYSPAVFFHNAEQEALIYQTKERIVEELKKPVLTAIYPYEVFYLAEERHQKYKLQRQPELMAEIRIMFPDVSDFFNSTAAARINGYLYGCGSTDRLKEEIAEIGFSSAFKKVLFHTAQ